METTKINITLSMDVEHSAASANYNNKILKPLCIALYCDNQLNQAAKMAFAYRIAHSTRPETMIDELMNLVAEIRNNEILEEHNEKDITPDNDSQ